MNEIKRKKYESPLTEMARVQLEDGICAGSSQITNHDNASGRIEEHSINTGFGGDFSESGWDADPTKPATE